MGCVLYIEYSLGIRCDARKSAEVKAWQKVGGHTEHPSAGDHRRIVVVRTALDRLSEGVPREL